MAECVSKELPVIGDKMSNSGTKNCSNNDGKSNGSKACDDKQTNLQIQEQNGMPSGNSYDCHVENISCNHDGEDKISSDISSLRIETENVPVESVQQKSPNGLISNNQDSITSHVDNDNKMSNIGECKTDSINQDNSDSVNVKSDSESCSSNCDNCSKESSMSSAKSSVENELSLQKESSSEEILELVADISQEASTKTETVIEIIRPRIKYVIYESEKQMPDIMRLITKDLSEPYSIYTYRYFIHNWPNLCFLSMDGEKCVGAIVCKLDMHKKMVRRGYIAMLAVDQDYRRRKIGTHLVVKAIKAMVSDGCDEVVLETEVTNKSALRLYENLGFVRDKRLFRYYLNGVDALRLKLWLR